MLQRCGIRKARETEGQGAECEYRIASEDEDQSEQQQSACKCCHHDDVEPHDASGVMLVRTLEWGDEDGDGSDEETRRERENERS
jgi:hypothetical protein